ncbi:B-box zinc finger protein 22-like [Impatiens glandulifera]|uniref:B-box zinc finger protein 22-like n=1 Tax=Impatiens glandulifera TaxID=253017 RepID=UPI001FB1021E|nr:B-box zinc finger protein 22-like [Impatiens glandulifera]
MKIQCCSCEAAEAKVLCCEEEAALCLSCDQKIHSLNNLAGKHGRVSLSSSISPTPKCDICQETICYFFCLEHRALLCRKCDSMTHEANLHVSRHQRFLLTGVKVGLEETEYQNSDEDDMGQPSFDGLMFSQWGSEPYFGSAYVNQQDAITMFEL